MLDVQQFSTAEIRASDENAPPSANGGPPEAGVNGNSKDGALVVKPDPE